MPKPQQLRIIIGSLEVGGAERHLSYVLPQLAKLGWKIKVLVLNPKITLAPFLAANNIEIIVINRKPLPNNHSKIKHLYYRGMCIINTIWQLRREFVKDKDSITHFFLPEAYILGMIAAIIARLPAAKIMSRRSLNYYQQKRPLLGWVEPKLHRFTDKILCNSKAVNNQLCLSEKVASEHTQVIYNGIDVNNFKKTIDNDALIKELKSENASCIMVMVANLIPYKGHLDLLHALAAVKNQLPPNWQMLFAGSGTDEYTQQLKNLAAKLQIANHIKWLGRRQDIAKLYSIANFGILCSHQEGFSNAVLEAAACSLAMIVTNAGGNAEAVIDGETGIVVPIKDVDAIAAAIKKLALNPQLATAYGNNARINIENNFSLEKCVAEYNNFYLGL